MMIRLIALALAALLAAAPAAAQPRETIGTGRIFTNDYFGDGNDRWQTGSYTYGIIRAPRPHDGVSQGFGELLEYRFEGRIIAPQGAAGGPGDRPYVGALSAGVFTHFGLGIADVSLGADVEFVGPQTGLAGFQERAHDLLGLPPVRTGNQIGDAVHLNGTVDVSTTLEFGRAMRLRPFAEARLGVEDLARIGLDLTIGEVGIGDLHLREKVTGQLYPGTRAAHSGFAFTAGADITSVGDSAYLPAARGYVVSDTRTRARVGIRYRRGADFDAFYGLTYLGEEYAAQPEGQTVGSLTLNFNF